MVSVRAVACMFPRTFSFCSLADSMASGLAGMAQASIQLVDIARGTERHRH